jgi:Flp pilus assembly protein TadD
MLRTACEAGDMAACSDLGVALHVAGDTAAARAAFERACTGELKAACRHVEPR